MPEPGLVICILCLPLLVAVVELIRTFALIRNSPNRERGIWSQATHVSGPPLATARSVPGPAAAGRPSTPAPGLR